MQGGHHGLVSDVTGLGDTLDNPVEDLVIDQNSADSHDPSLPTPTAAVRTSVIGGIEGA